MVFIRHRLYLWGIIAFLLGIAVTLSRPSVQTWLFRAYLARHPEWGLQVDEARLGWGHFLLKQVTFSRGQNRVNVAEFEGTLPLGATFAGNVFFDRLSLRGVEANFQFQEVGRPKVETEPAGTAELRLLERIRERMRFPLPMRLGEFELDGRVILNAGSGHKATLDVSARGGDFAPSRTGNLTVMLRAANLAPEGFVNALEARTEWRMHMVDTQAFDHMTLVSDITAVGPRFPGGTHLKTLVNLGLAERSPTCEVLATTEAQGEVRPLVHIRSESDLSAGSEKGTWKVDLNQSDLTPYALGFAVPPFSAMGSGRFALGTLFEIEGELDLVTSDMQALAPSLANVHSLKSNLLFDVVQEGPRVQLRRFRLRSAADAPVAEFEVLRPLSLLYSNGHYDLERQDGDWVRIGVQGLPWSWLQPFLGPVAVEGAPLHGAWILGIDNGVARLRPVGPLATDLRSLSIGGDPVCGPVELTAFCTATVLKEGWQLEIRPLEVRTEREGLANMSLKLGQSFAAGSGVKTQGVLRADLALLRRASPRVLKGLYGGMLSMTFDGGFKQGLLQLACEARADHVTRLDGALLPDVTSSMRLDLHENLAADVDASVVLTEEKRKTDIALLGTFRTGAGGLEFDATVQADSIETEDLTRSVLAWWPFWDTQIHTSNATAGEQPTVAPWGRLKGKLGVGAKRLVFPTRGNLGNLALKLSLAPDALLVDHFEGTVGEGSEVTGKGEIAYIAGTPEPFHYAGVFQAKDMDLGPVLTLTHPERAPVVDGKFDVLLIGKGSAKTTDSFFANATADVTFTSRGGLFHGFDETARSIDVAKLTQPTSRLSSIVDFAVSVISRPDKRNAAAESGMSNLINLAYDQVFVDIRHRPGQATEVREFSLIAPEIRILGSGRISFLSQSELVDRPLALTLELRLRGKQGENFRQLGLLDSTVDALGYAPLKKALEVEGSLYDFRSPALVELITQALTR